MGRRPPESVTPGAGRRGATLAVVLWVLVALGALSVVAATAARVDLALSRAWSDHAAALGLAEAGVADALAAIAAGGTAAGSIDGTLSTGSYRAEWAPVGARVRIVATGSRGDAFRQVEAWVEPAAEGPRIVAWRERR